MQHQAEMDEARDECALTINRCHVLTLAWWLHTALSVWPEGTDSVDAGLLQMVLTHNQYSESVLWMFLFTHLASSGSRSRHPAHTGLHWQLA